MRSFLLLFFLSNLSCIHAQFSGGDGKGDTRDYFIGIANGPQVITQVAFLTQPPAALSPNETFSFDVELLDQYGNRALFSNQASGSVTATFGNNPSSATLSGTTTVTASGAYAQFSNLSVNNTGFDYTLQATVSTTSGTSANFDVFNIYVGGSGKGDANATSPLANDAGQSVVIWSGGTVGNETNWATAANWVDGVVPTASDLVYIEPNGNGHNPVLTANTTVSTVNFNAGQKLIELGNYTLSLTDAKRASSIEYVKTNGSGSLKRESLSTGATFTFPVGNSSYNPLGITNNTTTSNEWYSVRVMDEVYEYGTYGNVLSDRRVKRTWDIGKQIPNSTSGNGVNLIFNWNSGEESTPPPTNYALFHHNADGNGWGEVVMGSSSKNNNTFTYTGYKGSFSPFGIGDPADPLPVDLIYFDGNCSPEGIDFAWATAAEVNSKSFDLQHSQNLSDWSSLISIPAAGFSSVEKNYALNIPFSAQPLGPYFRLHQLDFDGKFEIFPPLHLECSTADSKSLVLYPNPSSGVVFLSGLTGDLHWDLSNANGQVIRSGRLSPDSKSDHQLQLDNLPAGVYIFQTQQERLPLVILP
jgi:hypothetical protein